MTKKTKKTEKRPTLLNALLARPERDREYMSDLNTQWDQLDRKGRVRFVVGGVFGAIVFVAALGLVLWLISLIMNG